MANLRFHDAIEKVRDELVLSLSLREYPGKEFLANGRAEEILDRDRLVGLFASLDSDGWDEDYIRSFVARIIDDDGDSYVRIVAILIFGRCYKSLSNIVEILDCCKSLDPVAACDATLPFDAVDVQILLDPREWQSFLENQYIFCAITIREWGSAASICDVYKENSRLPFIFQNFNIDDSESTPRVVCIYESHFQGRSSYQKAPSAQRLLAYKSYKSQEDPELDKITALRKISRRNEHFQYALAAFQVGERVGLCYEIADSDLMGFLTTYDGPASCDFNLRHNLLRCCLGIIDAIEFLQSESKGFGYQYPGLCLLNLSPFTIVVFGSDGENLDRMTWKVTDFSVSKMKFHELERTYNIWPGSYPEYPEGSPGFMPPESHLRPESRLWDGTCWAIWSFGCVLTLALRVGLRETISDFLDSLHQEQPDEGLPHTNSFYSFKSDGPVLKDSVHKCLIHLQNRAKTAGSPEEIMCDSVIELLRRDILQPEWRKRASALSIKSVLSIICQDYKKAVQELQEKDLSLKMAKTTQWVMGREGEEVNAERGEVTSNSKSSIEDKDSGYDSSIRGGTLPSRTSLFSGGIVDEEGFTEQTNLEDLEDLHSGDVGSIISDVGDIGSQICRYRSHQEFLAEENLATLLADNQELKVLYKIALSNIPKVRLVNNLRKMLRRYHMVLSRDANTNLEAASANLIRTRWSRIRIAQKIVDIIDPDSYDDDLEIKRSEGTVDKRASLEAWLAGNPGFSTPVAIPPDQITSNKVADLEHFGDGEDSQDSSDETDSEGEGIDSLDATPKIAEVERFLLEGDAFHMLLSSFRTFLLPASLSSLTRVLLSIPRNRIWFSNKNDNSFSNKFKIGLEELTNEEWDWWPLRPKMRMLLKDEVRINWICHCNKHSWAEITKSQAERYDLLLPHNPESISKEHLCSHRQRKAPRNSISTKGYQLGGYDDASNTEPPTTPSSTQTSSQGTTTNSRSSGEDSRSRSSSFPSEISSIDRKETVVNIITGTNVELFMLLGISGTRKTVKLAQLDVTKHSNDQDLFNDIRRQYRELRGFWKYWLSPYQLKSFDFVKFNQIQRDRVVLQKLHDLPEDLTYEYNPRPAIEMPPINSHEFENALLPVCKDFCPWALFHDCGQSLIGTWALQRIPKRKGALDIKTGARQHAWGIQANYKPSALLVFIYHLLLFTLTFIFWIWWQVSHPDDLQDASVPFTTVGVMIATFWSVKGALKTLE